MTRWSPTEKNYHMRKRFEPKVIEFCEDCSGKVLDLGCGVQPFREYLSHVEYVGLDRDPVKDGIMGDALSLPFDNDSFDHILSTQVLEHVPDPFQFFAETSRILKKGGSALITTNMMWNLHMGPDDYFRFTRFGLEELAERSQLQVNNIIEVGTIPMRVCQKINDAYEYILPKQVVPAFNIVTNSIFYPILDFDTHRDYILVGVEVENNA